MNRCNNKTLQNRALFDTPLQKTGEGWRNFPRFKQYIHPKSKKTRHPTHVDNFAKYKLILKNF